jgi:hypothetical protein
VKLYWPPSWVVTVLTVAVGRFQRDHGAIDALLARILHAIAILVFPDAITELACTTTDLHRDRYCGRRKPA